MAHTNYRAKTLFERFISLVRPDKGKIDAPSTLEEFDKAASQIEQLESETQRFPICLLGQAGVGKSTLINTLIDDTKIVVPSGGGTGPLTANALRVVYGERPSFVVQYHAKKRLDETRFILETELVRRAKADARSAEATADGSHEELEIQLDSEEQRKSRIDDAIGRARLLVAGSQTAKRDEPYLVDALRYTLDQASKFASDLLPEDIERLHRVSEALQHATKDSALHIDSADDPAFIHQLRDHACGFLAPLILEMTIHWPSPLLHDSLELVDLPGIGILSDVYASVTADYLRNRAKAVMLVVDSRGIRREDAELLKSSGFLNRLLHSSDDLAADPVALLVAVVKIDDVAVENWRNDKSANGAALKSKAAHFEEQVQRCRADVAERLHSFLKEVWEQDSEGKRLVVESILSRLAVFPVSAPQYRLLCSTDEDEDKPFLPNVDATNIPALRAAVSDIAQACLAERNRRHEEACQRFFDQLRARLEVVRAQRDEERQAEEEVTVFRQKLDDFVTPLRREFDTRRGGFRNFLRKTIPTQIESKVTAASQTARKAIYRDLGELKDAHWKTLQAAVRREGTFHGSRHINLPHDFALRFEEPVAEVWSRGILVEVRRETRGFSEYQSQAVTKVLDWARSEGMRRSTRLLEALVHEVQQHRKNVDAVGKEAVAELRAKVRSELIRTIENPIRTRCKKFVTDNQHVGRGVKTRILDLFADLADEVVEVALEPAVRLLVKHFEEVEKEILSAFREHGDPLTEAADALIQRQERRVIREDSQFAKALESAWAAMPPGRESRI